MKSSTPLNQSKSSSNEGKNCEMEKKPEKEPKPRPRKRKDQSGQKETAAKPDNQLDISYISPSSTKQQKTGKPKTKIKSCPRVARGHHVKSARNISRSLPAKPEAQSHTQGSAPKTKIKQTLPTASELKEVPVVQTTVPFYASSASFLGSVQSDPDFILGLPQHYDIISLSSRTSMNKNVPPSGEQLRPGSIIDGSSTYRDGSITNRSVVAGSVYSVVTLDNISVHQDQSSNLMSARPLPVPPGR